MSHQNSLSAANRKTLRRALFAATLPVDAFAAEVAISVSQEPSAIWDIVIAVFVCSVAASVAYLCYGAVRLWVGYWRAMAITPLLLLALWVSTLVAGTLLNSATRPLWSFELLFWAMATTIYLVMLFTARRTFEKAALEKKNQL